MPRRSLAATIGCCCDALYPSLAVLLRRFSLRRFFPFHPFRRSVYYRLLFSGRSMMFFLCMPLYCANLSEILFPLPLSLPCVRIFEGTFPICPEPLSRCWTIQSRIHWITNDHRYSRPRRSNRHQKTSFPTLSRAPYHCQN